MVDLQEQINQRNINADQTRKREEAIVEISVASETVTWNDTAMATDYQRWASDAGFAKVNEVGLEDGPPDAEPQRRRVHHMRFDPARRVLADGPEHHAEDGDYCCWHVARMIRVERLSP